MTTNVPTVLVMGIKGGVGKTILSNNISRLLAKSKKVGIIDMDLDSSNLSRVMDITETMKLNKSRKFIPVHVIDNKLKLFSMGIFTNSGPQSYSRTGDQNRILIQQALDNTEWGGDIDLFLLDQPAGSGDEFRATIENFTNIHGAVIATQPTTSDDLYRCFDLTSRFFIPILGVIQNMHGAVCECGCKVVCKKCNKPYFPLGTESPVEEMCTEWGVPYMGAIPMIPKLKESPIIKHPYNKPIKNIVKMILDTMEE